MRGGDGGAGSSYFSRPLTARSGPHFYSGSQTHLREVHSWAMVVTGCLLSPLQPQREVTWPIASPVPRISPWSGKWVQCGPQLLQLPQRTLRGWWET